MQGGSRDRRGFCRPDNSDLPDMWRLAARDLLPPQRISKCKFVPQLPERPRQAEQAGHATSGSTSGEGVHVVRQCAASRQLPASPNPPQRTAQPVPEMQLGAQPGALSAQSNVAAFS